MVYLEFVGIEGNDVVYDYMPESKSADRGTVSVNKDTRKRTLCKRSDDGIWSAYHSHAWDRIDEMLDAGELEEETSAAWY